jgi:hypothetical protein
VVYMDKPNVLKKLINDSNYTATVEVYDEHGRLIAGLFQGVR